MLSWIISTALNLRVVVACLAAVLIVWGIHTVSRTPLDVFPEFAPPLVEIQRLAEEQSLGLPFDPREPRSISTAVGRLSDEPGLAAGLRQNVERARAELSWEREEAVVAELVRSTLGRGADGGTL